MSLPDVPSFLDIQKAIRTLEQAGGMGGGAPNGLEYFAGDGFLEIPMREGDIVKAVTSYDFQGITVNGDSVGSVWEVGKIAELFYVRNPWGNGFAVLVSGSSGSGYVQEIYLANVDSAEVQLYADGMIYAIKYKISQSDVILNTILGVQP